MRYGEEKKDKLNQLERKLYSRNAPNIISGADSDADRGLGQDNFDSESVEPRQDWQETKPGNFDELASKISNMAQKKHNFVNKIFVFSLLFFLVAAAVAGFVFWGGMNSVSSRNVDIKLTGPLEVGGGQEVSFSIDVINNNNTDLDSASLIVKYPAGTRLATDLTKDLAEERFTLQKIKSGESFSQNIKAVFFGEKGSSKQIQISLEYRVANSSALFYKEKSQEISISSAPVIVTPTYPKEVNSNQEISFSLELTSNSKDKINNFLVKVEYPFGFVFKDATPATSFGNNIWQFSNLNPGEKKKITFRGNIIGQDNEEKVFRVNVGTASQDDERAIAVPFSELVESITLKKPFVGLDFLIEGENSDLTSQGGSQVGSTLVVRNNLPDKLFNVSVTVSFKGGAFDKSSVLPGSGGFFQSANNTILWDKREVPEFAEMEPGSVKNLSFRLTPLLYANIVKGAKPEIEMSVTVKGERLLDSGLAEDVMATEQAKIILATSLSLSAKSVRAIGNIENSGPIPPKADNRTTYTILWSISNSFNQVSGAEVRATLPSYVKWTGLKSPESEIISYNQVTNEVIWNVGSILSNTGFGSAPKQVYFQLELLPSLSQVGQAPALTSEANLSATDKVTGLKVSARASAVSTNFAGDPSFKTGDDKVVQ